MPREDGESMLGANLDRGFVASFWEKATPEGTGEKTNKGQIVQAMANLWLDMPEDVRKEYLWPVSGQSPLTTLVQQIVQSQLDNFRAGLTPAERKILDKDTKQTKRKIGRKR